jgi:hypothetical protein
MAVPIAAKARKRLDERNSLAGGGAETRPVATAENAYDRSADGGREMERSGVVADVEAGGLKEPGKNGYLTVSSEPERGSRAADSNGFASDGF